MTDAPEDEPLDPAVEAIRQKMVKLLMVSGGIMCLGLMAVLFAIVYKLNSAPSDGAAVLATEQQLIVPKGAIITSSSTSENSVLINLRMPDGSTRLQLHDRSGKLISGYSVREE